MILFDARLWGEEKAKHIHLAGGRIRTISDSREALEKITGETILHLEGATLLPGLINSHDHLDFNLFPRLGNRIYSNYKEWGHAIQRENRDKINEILKIPQHLRVSWGVYKNLLNGFTTVVNHGDKLNIRESLISVLQDTFSLHSPGFEKKWKWKLNNPFLHGKTFVMHLGEGTDAAAIREIDEVRKHNFFKRKIIAIHGVGMTEEQASSFPGLVWCPASNYFLLEKTARVDKLKDKIRIVFGTDSTLTSSWNAWEQFRLAMDSGLMNRDELLNALTVIPAALWNIPDAGLIKENMIADLIAVKNTGQLFDNNPEDILLVIQKGVTRVIDNRFTGQLKAGPGDGYSEIILNHSVKRVEGNLQALVSDIKKHFPAAYIPFSCNEH